MTERMQAVAEETLHILTDQGKGAGGVLLANGDLMTYFWCTSQGVTHTRWVRLQVD